MTKPPKLCLTAGLIVGLMSAAGAIVSVVWAASADRSAVIEGQKAHTIQLGDHETRLRSIERTASEIGQDVKWIRQTMELNHPRSEE